jgi:hypothetical protein
VFYGDLIYKLKKIEGNVNFSMLFVTTICKLKMKGYQHDILQRSAGLVINLSKVELIIMLTSLVARRWQGFKSL